MSRRSPRRFPAGRCSGTSRRSTGSRSCELEDIEPLGFNLVTMHYLEKGSMFGMLDYGRHVFRDRTTAYADDHTMGGLTKEEQAAVMERGDRRWLDAERSWNAD